MEALEGLGLTAATWFITLIDQFLACTCVVGFVLRFSIVSERISGF